MKLSRRSGRSRGNRNSSSNRPKESKKTRKRKTQRKHLRSGNMTKMRNWAQQKLFTPTKRMVTRKYTRKLGALLGVSSIVTPRPKWVTQSLRKRIKIKELLNQGCPLWTHHTLLLHSNPWMEIVCVQQTRPLVMRTVLVGLVHTVLRECEEPFKCAVRL